VLLTGLTATAADATRRQPPELRRLDPLIPIGRSFLGPIHSPRDCRRWRAAAARLGETYAGFRLRQTIVARACAFSDEARLDEPWSWPWRVKEMRSELPPRLVSRFGDWQIRCGHAGQRRRCVLAVTRGLAGPPDPDVDDLPLVAHFVIDQVGGREVLLWRLHVIADLVRTGGLEIVMAKRRRPESFDVCGRIGCMAETETRLSAEAANWLWDGKAIEIQLAGENGHALAATLPGLGFRAGLSELIRLRRLESRTLAGR
jgi:invasion protein IalB